MEEEIRLPAGADSVPAARRFIRDHLAGCPRLDDALLIVSELATNALHHGPSIDFIVRVVSRRDWARIEVFDEGNTFDLVWRPPDGDPDGEAESGRGLNIVCAVATNFGHDRTDEGTTVWAELHWPDG